jgi:hypothetical protein
MVGIGPHNMQLMEAKDVWGGGNTQQANSTLQQGMCTSLCKRRLHHGCC